MSSCGLNIGRYGSNVGKCKRNGRAGPSQQSEYGDNMSNHHVMGTATPKNSNTTHSIAGLPFICFRQQYLIATQDLALSLKIEPVRIHQNFKRNEKRFKEHRHYFVVTGSELKFLSEQHNGFVSKHTSQMILWTISGALNIAKTVETDEAWLVYEQLSMHFVRELGGRW